MSPDTIRACVESGRINLCHCVVGIDEIELILTVLRLRGNVTVENCGGVMGLMELGAYLRSIESK